MQFRRAGLVIALIVVVAAAGGSYWRWRSQLVDLSLPAVLEGKEPIVVALAEETIKKVSAAPEEPGAWLMLGYVYEANALPALALESYQRALDIDDTFAKAWYRLARVQMSLGDRSGAIEAGLRVAELVPEFVTISWRLGFWYLDQGSLGDARQWFERAVEIDGREPAGWWGLARVLMQEGQPLRAAEVLEDLVEKWPDDAYAHHLLGTAYRQLGRWGAAAAELELGAGSAPVWHDDWDVEMTRYRTGLEVELDRATALFQVGRLNESIGALEKLRQLYPDELSVLNNLGAAYVRQGRYQRALEVYGPELEKYPRDANLHYNLALAYLALQDSTQALVHLDETIALEPRAADALEKKGAILKGTRRLREAIEVYQQARLYDPQNAELHLQLGMVQWAEGEREAGLANLMRAVELDSAFTVAYVAIGEAQKKLGALDEAEAAFEKASALNPRLDVLLRDLREQRARRVDK